MFQINLSLRQEMKVILSGVLDVTVLFFRRAFYVRDPVVGLRRVEPIIFFSRRLFIHD
jgi:hypothetical protein